MKYYSEKLQKLFDDTKSLEEAEGKFALEEADKAKKAEERKLRAKQVDEAYNKVVEARKQAAEIINDAEKEYENVLDDFVKDYGSYHRTYTKTDTDNQTTGTSWGEFFNTLLDTFYW